MQTELKNILSGNGAQQIILQLKKRSQLHLLEN